MERDQLISETAGKVELETEAFLGIIRDIAEHEVNAEIEHVLRPIRTDTRNALFVTTAFVVAFILVYLVSGNTEGLRFVPMLVMICVAWLYPAFRQARKRDVVMAISYGVADEETGERGFLVKCRYLTPEEQKAKEDNAKIQS